MDLDTAAKELGRLISQTPEYKYYNAAAKDLEEDKETSGLLEKLKEYEQTVQEAQASGKEVPEVLRKEYTSCFEDIQSRSLIQALFASQENYIKLMDKVNKMISKGIQEGAQGRIITNF
ncbi:MAG TPA: YlbF family regulator [archaeon]|nr:YlbF family regulator [archaeon]